MSKCALALIGLLWASLAAAAAERPPSHPRSEHVATARLLASLIDGEIVRVADTHSMEPVLGAHDLLVLERIGFAELNEGDVVVFMRRAHRLHGQFLQRGWVGHRIVEIRNNYVLTKGDNPSARVDADHPNASTIRGRIAYAVNGQTGDIRDMRTSRAGELLTFNQAFARERSANRPPEVSSRLVR